MEWAVVYLEPLEVWLNELNNEQLKCISKEIKLLELCGNQLRLPHSKSLGGGLFELRERHFGLRVYYGFNDNRCVVLLNAGDKSTQKRDIKKARELLQQYGK